MGNAQEAKSTASYYTGAKPILKWAGGKTQLLGSLLPKIPSSYNHYIEPFLGGGAMFFAVQPRSAIIADSNPELINMYRQVADKVEDVIHLLQNYVNTEAFFYEIRGLSWNDISPVEAAARTIYLNHTCYNGLYRVNKHGQFNVPFGKYKNPKICDADGLRTASAALKKAEILCGDFMLVLEHYAQPNDFVFLDPPYLPVSEYADFKRYTKEQFYEEDHIELAKMVMTLHERGCNIVLTNSNHPLVHELYAPFSIDVIQTKRHISCNGSSRKGEDVIVTIPAKMRKLISLVPKPLPDQVKFYPPTRFMGSKRKLLSDIWTASSNFRFETVVDLFSGSGIVGYMFKTQGKTVISNDYMAMSATFAKAMIENNSITLPICEAQELLTNNPQKDCFVQDTFKGLYFTDEENKTIDNLRANIKEIRDPYKRAIAMSALIRACTKKRPRGIFTYTGERYNDGRKDLQKTLQEQFLDAVSIINNAIFDNGRINSARWSDAMDLKISSADLVYIDPPYYSPFSDNEYVRRYHFVEGLARDWKGVDIQQNTQTKKFKSYPTPFSTRKGASDAFDHLFRKFSNSVLIVSYSSNSLPTQDEMVALIAKYKEHVEVVPIDYTYSFGNQKEASTNKNRVKEYLFIGYDEQDVKKND